MQHRRYAFIVRIWFELEPDLEGSAPALRGSVQHIPSEQMQYFRAFDQLVHFLEQATAGQSDRALACVQESQHGIREQENRIP